MQLSVHNCSPLSDSVLMIIVSILIKKAIIVSNITLWQNSGFHSTVGVEKISALPYHKGTLIFYYFCTQLWMPGPLPRSLHFKNKKNSTGCFPVPTGVLSGSVGWPQGCVFAAMHMFCRQRVPPPPAVTAAGLSRDQTAQFSSRPELYLLQLTGWDPSACHTATALLGKLHVFPCASFISKLFFCI